MYKELTKRTWESIDSHSMKCYKFKIVLTDNDTGEHIASWKFKSTLEAAKRAAFSASQSSGPDGNVELLLNGVVESYV